MADLGPVASFKRDIHHSSPFTTLPMPPYIFGWTPENDLGDTVDIPEHHFTFSAPSPSSSMGQVPPSPPSDPEPQARIPRPPNPFILFRTDFARKFHNPQRTRPRRPSTIGRTVSGKAADAWRELPAHEKERYRRLAEEAKRQHAIDYPDYQYRPQRRGTQATSASSSSSRRRAAPVPAPIVKKRSRSPALSIHTTHITAMDALKITDSPPLNKRSCSPELVLPQPVASGSSIKADRRRSSSVPVTSGEHYYTLGIWPSVEEQPSGDGWEPPVQSRRRSRSVNEWINLVPSFQPLPDATYLDPRSPQNVLFEPNIYPTPFRVLSPNPHFSNTVHPATLFAPPQHMSPLTAVASSLAAWNGTPEPSTNSVPATPMAPRPVRPNPPTWLVGEGRRFDSSSPQYELQRPLTPITGDFQWAPSVEFEEPPATSSSMHIGEMCDQGSADALETYEFGLQERVHGGEEPAADFAGMYSDDPADELRF